MIQVPFQLFDHTADVGLYAYGENLEELFQHAGQGFSEIVSDLRQIESNEVVSFELEGLDPVSLLHQFLSELIYLLDTQSLLFSDFTLQLSGSRMRVEARGERFDAKKHPFKTEIKAITLHQMKIEEEKGIYRATLIFDL